jgi:hypothetical protein
MRLVLETKDTQIASAEAVADFDAVKDSLTVFFEAESFIGRCASGASVYSTRSFLSGGAGVTGFNNPTSILTYEVEVPEDGKYDLVVKYVSWEQDGAVRSLYVDGKEYGFSLPKTSGWGTTPSEWIAGVAPLSIELTKGKHTLVVQPRLGLWNVDWFGLIKR